MTALLLALALGQMTVYDEGTLVAGRVSRVNCSGSGVTCSSDGGTWALAVTVAGIDAGAYLTSVTASAPLSSSGGTTPNVSFTGTLSQLRGGTGAGALTCATGQFLWSDGGSYGCESIAPVCPALQVLTRGGVGSALSCTSQLAGGDPGEVQWNNAGALDGIANARSDGVNLTIGSDGGTPSAPTRGSTLYSRWSAARASLGYLPSTGAYRPLQRGLNTSNQVVYWSCTASATAPTGLGPVSNTTGTITYLQDAPTNTWVQRPRCEFKMTASKGQQSCMRSSNGRGLVYLSSVAGTGGFYLHTTCTNSQMSNTAQFFMGVAGAAGTGSITAANCFHNISTTASILTFPNLAGIGGAWGATTLSVIGVNDGGTPTTSSLGASFPMGLGPNDAYDFEMYAPPGSTTITYSITKVSDGTHAEGTFGAQPDPYVPLTPIVSLQNGVDGGTTGGTADRFECTHMYYETEWAY